MERTVCILIFFTIVVFCDALDGQNDLEARGKKKKIGLLIYFADLIVKKLFIVKLIYAFVLWCIVHKAGYFLSWFVSYLKEKKNEDHSHGHYHYEIPHHGHHYDSGPHHSYDSYGPYRKSYKDTMK